MVCPILLFIGYVPISGETGRNKNAVGGGHDISSFSSNGDDRAFSIGLQNLFTMLVFPEEDENLVNAIFFSSTTAINFRALLSSSVFPLRYKHLPGKQLIAG